MPAGVTEDFNEEIRAAVDDFWLITKIWRAIDHAEQFDNPRDAVEIAERLFGGRDDADADIARDLVALFDGQIGAALAARLIG